MISISKGSALAIKTSLVCKNRPSLKDQIKSLIKDLESEKEEFSLANHPDSTQADKDELIEKIAENSVNLENLFTALKLNIVYLALTITLFYFSFNIARKKGTLINIGE